MFRGRGRTTLLPSSPGPYFPPYFLRVSITLMRKGFHWAVYVLPSSVHPLRARWRHLPPLALFIVRCARDAAISHHESTLCSALDFERLRRMDGGKAGDFKSVWLCFAKFATHETCPSANELHLKLSRPKRPRRSNVETAFVRPNPNSFFHL